MENKLTPELIEKAKEAKTPEELLTLAKENGVEITAEEANAYFAQLHKSGEISDDELDSVSGGGKCGTIYHNKRPVITAGNSCNLWRCEVCHKTDEGSLHCMKHGRVCFCSNCDSSRYEDGLLLCFHPDRYDN